MFQAVIFDMDGILIDSEVFNFERRLAYLRAVGVTPGTTDIQDFLGQSAEAKWQLVIPDPAIRARVRAGFYPYKAAHPITYADHVMPGIQDTARWLHAQGIRVAVASAGSRAEIQRMLTATGMAPYFQVILSGTELTENKPDPQIYRLAVTQLAVPPANCLVIEDSRVGLTAAKRAGLTVWALQPKQYHIDQSEADWQFADYEEFRRHFADVQRAAIRD